MDIIEAKKEVIKAGKLLLETGLIARTWGNISCRISDTQFVVTPSGRSYESLLPEDIVIVNIADTSYEGDVKPSSEKGIHADCYKLRPNANFVIHTHQTNASVLSVLNRDVVVKGADMIKLLGTRIPCAAYGLPGTKRLRGHVRRAISSGGGNAVIMAHHGALCFGEDFGEAFKTALNVEKACRERFAAAPSDALSPFKGYAAETERVGDEIKTVTSINDGCADAENLIHSAIYDARPDINHIIHNTGGYAVSCSQGKKTLRPLLDDFAQLVGRNLKIAAENERDIAKKVRGRNAVLVRGRGAYCFAATRSDTGAVDAILNKGCKTKVEASKLGKPKPLGRIDCVIMRIIYLKKYSKQQ